VKKETRGRKPTGRVRTLKLSAKFTESERERILDIVKQSGYTQSDCLIMATEFFICHEKRKKKPEGK
jgi:hypothetical protein